MNRKGEWIRMRMNRKREWTRMGMNRKREWTRMEMNRKREWRIIACESSDYRHIVHDDGFVWLMFVHERFSASEQTLNSQNHGVHYISVITRLTCNNSILLTRNSPDWQTYRDDTADDTVLCIFGIVLGMTGLRLWLACIHKGNIRTS